MKCAIPACERELINSWPTICPHHWSQIPEWLRSPIRKSAPRPGEPQSQEYREAVQTASGWLDNQARERETATDNATALARRITGERDE
jgi:hypothetical protein